MALRQSIRLQSRPKTAPIYAYDSEDSDNAKVDTTGQKRKRKEESPVPDTRTAVPIASSSKVEANDIKLTFQEDVARPAKRVKGKRGILQQLVEMPLELLFEIFGKLDPMDVLNLARSTKALRGILMSRSAADIWREALTNVPGLPECPTDLNGPQWVDLVFGRNCHFCGRTNGRTTQTYAWQARVRGCFSCVFKMFPISANSSSRSILELLPAFNNRSQGRRSDRGVHYHGPTYHKFVEIEKRLTNLEERKKWFDEQKQAKEYLANHAKLCETWLGRLVEERAQDLEDLRNQRKQVLRRKLEALGYGSMIDMAFKRDEFWKCPIISASLRRDLTDRVWTGVQTKVIDIMENFRDEFVKLQRDRDLKSRFKVLLDVYKAEVEARPPNELIPPVGDIFQLPEVQAIMLEEPLGTAIDQTAIKDIFQQMPEHNQTWGEKVFQKLADLIKPHAGALGLESVDESTLDLAIAVFNCKRCYSATQMHARRALYHKCTSEETSYSRGSTVYDDETLKAFVNYSSKCPWNEGALSFDLTGAQYLVYAATVAGLDLKTATIEALDELDPIFQVETNTFMSRTMLTWRGVMSGRVYINKNLKLQDEETSIIIRGRLDETMKRGRTGADWGKYIYCTHCPDFPAASGYMRLHLKEKHSIHVATDADVWIHPDHPWDRLSFEYFSYPGATVI